MLVHYRLLSMTAIQSQLIMSHWSFSLPF